MEIAQSNRWWDDEDFQDRLVTLLTKDYKALKDCGTILVPEDFRPLRGMKNGRARSIVSERALEYYQKYHQPLGSLLRSDVLEYCEQLNLPAGQIEEIKKYVIYLGKLKPEAPDSLVEKVRKFKGQRFKASAIQELTELQGTDSLTDEKWREISSKALAATGNLIETVSFHNSFDDRMLRRKRESIHSRTLWTFIDPLDAMVKGIGPGELALVLAPWKRGKSFFLLWMAVAYTLQRLKVLYITLEDPRKRVEDRLDSIVSAVPIKSLRDKPVTLRRKFEAFRSMSKNIEIYDGTEGGTTWAKIEQIYLNLRDKGFTPEAVIIDYDEELTPSHRYTEKIHEYDEIYRDGRRFMSTYNCVGWLAAQTQRGTRTLKVLSGDRIGQDIGKIKKVAMAISLGKGEWTEDSYYMYVAAHKNDKMEIGVEIIPDLERALVYDREATYREMKAHQADIP